MENMTRAPSQVIMKSASMFGEEAAKLLGKSIDETMKNCTNDITASLKECTIIASKKLEKSINSFGQTFKETGIDGLTEWGIAIERAFYHLGHKVETGLYNATGRASASVQETLDTNIDKISNNIREGTQNMTDNLFIKHIPMWKNQFQRELNILLACILLLCSSVFLWVCCSFVSLLMPPSALSPYIYHPEKQLAAITNAESTVIIQRTAPPLVYVLNTLLCAIFAAMFGYAIYVWDNKNSDKKIDASDSTSAATDSTSDSYVSKQKKERTLGPSTDAISRILNSSKTFIIGVGILGFFAGNVGHQLTSLFNPFLLLLILSCVALLAYRAFAFRIIFEMYKIYKRYQEFREWEKLHSNKLTSNK